MQVSGGILELTRNGICRLQFASRVYEALTDLREPIAKKLKEHVQMAKWEDHSYFALKVSSERNTRTLQKFCAQYAQALARPVTAVLKEVRARRVSVFTPSSVIVPPSTTALIPWRPVPQS